MSVFKVTANRPVCLPDGRTAETDGLVELSEQDAAELVATGHLVPVAQPEPAPSPDDPAEDKPRRRPSHKETD